MEEMNNSYSLKDSWEINSFLKIHNKIPSNHQIISLDIVSMYTNIPIELVEKAIDSGWNIIGKHTTIKKEHFIQGIKLCLNSNFFTYDNKFYTQKKGLAMGSPLSPILSEFAMNSLENTIINNSPIPIVFYKRYVDDCILCIPNNTHETILDMFNKFCGDIQFTLERESNDKINFLDLTISINRNNNTLETNWFQKLITSGRYLNFLSESPISHKKGCIYSLIDRCFKFSSGLDFQLNIQKIIKLFLENNYPLDFIQKTIDVRLKKLKHQKPQTHTLNNSSDANQTKSKSTNFVTIPYIKGISEAIAGKLKKYRLDVAYKPNNYSNQFFSVIKDKTNINDKTHLVYQINCNDCNAVYIGQTKQKLGNRINQHRNSVKNSNNCTALVDHVNENNHEFNFNSVKILKNENNYHKRVIHEMLQIKKNHNSINYRTDIQNLNAIYGNVV